MGGEGGGGPGSRVGGWGEKEEAEKEGNGVIGASERRLSFFRTGRCPRNGWIRKRRDQTLPLFTFGW